MGPNNRRAQQRAAQERNVPSRARFSKGPPPKKNGGRGRGGEGWDNDRDSDGGRGRGGRGGRGGRNNDAIIQKIQNRVQQQRNDIGGISVVQKSGKPSTSDARIASISRKSKHALYGIDVNKLDTITLSAESVAIVERLLRAYNVWEDDDENEDEKKCDDDDDDAVEIEKGTNDNESGEKEEEEELEHAKFKSNSSNRPIGADVADQTYDDYCGDYDDEPDYQCRKDDDIHFNHVDGADDYDDDTSSAEDSKEGTDSLEGDEEDDLDMKERAELINSPIFRHLTQHFSFQQEEVILALKASHKRLRLAKKKAAETEGGILDANELAKKKTEAEGDILDEKDDKESAKEDEGALLEMAMDWLSLHLEESDLRRGFRVQKITKPKPGITGTPSAERALLTIKAVPHDSISIMPKLTQSQYEKETKEALIRLKRQNLMTDLIRMGFHSKEVDQVFASMQIEKLLEKDTEDDLSILNGKLMNNLIACVESEEGDDAPPAIDEEIEKEMEEATIVERDQEKEVLEAIYAEGFQPLSGSVEGSDSLHYRVEVNPNTPLAHPACNEKCHLHVVTRRGYPLTSSPALWFTNTTLPPSLLRQISIKLKDKAKEFVGMAAVYDLMEYVAEDLAAWQKQFVDEEALAEKSSEDVEINKVGGEDSDDDEIDYYTTVFTAEERKKLSRRQRQKLRAAEKSHARDEVLLEKQRKKEQKDQERQERVKFENENISSRRAEQIVNSRWKEWVEGEAEKAARRAMNDAFLRDEGRDKAREAADVARKEMLRFHGELDEENADEKKEESAVTVDESKRKGAQNDSVTNGEAMKSLTGQSKVVDVGTTKEDGGETDQPKAKSEATPKTLLFVEKLRRMYEAKAKEKEKAAGTGEDSSKSGALHLTDASAKSEAVDLGGEIAKTHVPAPVVAPSPGIKDVLEDVLTIQRDQPWLISPEARVIKDDSVETIIDDARKNEKNETSRILKRELERKYLKPNQNSRGGGRQSSRHRNDRRGGAGGSKEFQEMLNQRSKLPAYKMRDELLSTIHQNQVTVVSGDTGCGKTTQVPQLVLDDLILNNRGAEANIIVTQPRRISAIGVSERIAAERCERIGQTVGYSIRLENKRSSKTRLLLCTTGILLRRLQCDPDLASVSHVFVDEVHERDLNTDFMLVILRDLLQRRKSLKLVLMSATLNAERFSNYFGGCPTVSIPGRAQPVKEYRLEDALEVTGHLVLEGSDCAKKRSSNRNDTDQLSKTALRRLYPNCSKNVIDSLAVVDESITNYELIAELLQTICTTMEDGAILVFLSGMKEITTAMEAITKIEYFQDSTNAIIYPLHSSLSNAEQKVIFQKPPKGKRKIVLSTNIAETSITIDDVVFVIDTGRVKENRYDDLNKMPTLLECWTSNAASKQRKGRAGRVKPGFCWHLFSSHTHDRVLDDYQLPEMLRVGLEDLVLQILVLDLGEPAQFLTKAVDPPTHLAIKNALQLLESLGAAECDWDPTPTSTEIVTTEEHGLEEVSTSLTALGYHLATLPVHPRVGKLLIYGALFGVFDDCLTIAAAMTSRSPFMSSFGNRDAADEAKRTFASDDHIAVLMAFNQWQKLRQRDGRQAKAFLHENFLSYMGLSNMIQLKKQLQKYMTDSGFASSSSHGANHTVDLHLVRAVIAAGLYPNIIIAPRSLGGKTAGEVPFRGQKNGEIYLHPCTIAFTAKGLDSRYGCYNDIVKTSKIYIRDCTAVSKFAILLFGGALKVYQTHGVCTVDDWLRFKVGAKPATLVKYLRSGMEGLLLEKIMDPAVDVAESPKGKAIIEAVASLLKMEGSK